MGIPVPRSQASFGPTLIFLTEWLIGTRPFYLNLMDARILKATIGLAISHLIRNFILFGLSEEELCYLSHALFAINSLPRLLVSQPNISFQIYLPDEYSNNTLRVAITYPKRITIGLFNYEDYERSEYKIEWIDEELDIDLTKETNLDLFDMESDLNNWIQHFMESNGRVEVSVSSESIEWYDDTDFYDPTIDKLGNNV